VSRAVWASSDSTTDVNTIRALLPESWCQPEAKALVAIYRVVRVPLERVGPEPFVTDVGSVRVAIVWATLKIPRTDCDVIFIEPQEEVRFAIRHTNDTPPIEGRFCVLAVNLTDGVPEHDARAQIEAARGFLCSYHGRNIAYDQSAELVLGLSDDTTGFKSPSVENPFVLAVPRLAEGERDRFTSAIARLVEVDAPTKNRFSFSLRWFGLAMGVSGPDGFLRLWIALEALAMPDSTNIRSISEYLAQSYGLQYADAVQEFMVGRLFGLRGDIVHRGSRRPITGDVLSYLAAIYIDVLLQVLGLPPEQRARTEYGATGGRVGAFLGVADGV